MSVDPFVPLTAFVLIVMMCGIAVGIAIGVNIMARAAVRK